MGLFPILYSSHFQLLILFAPVLGDRPADLEEKIIKRGVAHLTIPFCPTIQNFARQFRGARLKPRPSPVRYVRVPLRYCLPPVEKGVCRKSRGVALSRTGADGDAGRVRGLWRVDGAQTTVRAHAIGVISLASLDTSPVAVTRRLALVVQGHTILIPAAGIGGSLREKHAAEEHQRQD